ncbi:MAG: TfoX/Sxy family protein [Dehalogenimonas sp.]|uniref:TfoX/Sxy family protein n=1 Tax=Candidatus Dehalogenimonas loeffleri TaxID=3127115 RepID=A0ABZ2J8S6_9CHLR|nr:TfoX/Sxy family protein [Dehalogenimonas sp.]
MTGKQYLDLVLDKLTPLGAVTGKSMFGGFGVFRDSRMFGLISGDVLYLKAGQTNLAEYTSRDCPRFKLMPYYQVPADVFEDDDQLRQWARRSIELNQL